MHQLKHARRASTLSLFSSASTLVCCALPALFVTLGAGAVLAGLTSAVPQLIWMSKHKIELFIFGAVMLSLAGLMQWRARHAPCPIDPELANACMRQRRISAWIFGISCGLYLTGFTFAFILPYAQS